MYSANSISQVANIKVIGIGGGGNNAVNKLTHIGNTHNLAELCTLDSLPVRLFNPLKELNCLIAEEVTLARNGKQLVTGVRVVAEEVDKAH